MVNSKLIRIIKTLTKKEFKEFGIFLNSPFFNTNKKCVELYELIRPYAPTFDNSKLEQSNILSQLYKNQGSAEGIQKALLRLLERYLIQIHFDRKEEYHKPFLLQELFVRNERQHFSFTYRKAALKNEGEKENPERYYEAYLLEVSLLEMMYQYHYSRKERAIQLDKVIRSFDKYFLSNHLWLDNTMISTHNMGDEDVKRIAKNTKENADKISQIAGLPIYTESSLLSLRLLVRQLVLQNNEESFHALFEALQQKHERIDNLSISHFYKFLANYCIRETLKGDSSFFQHLLNLYRFAMKSGVFVEGKYLSPSRMGNLIITAAKSQEVDSAYELLDQHIKSVHPDYQNVTKIYCIGYIHFWKKEYVKATNYLLQCANMRNLFALDAETILYKIYYETNQDNFFDVPLKSFTIRLSRQKEKHLKESIESYLNFFRILKQLYRKKEDPNYKKNLDDIRSRIETMKYLSDKQWLLQKIKELED